MLGKEGFILRAATKDRTGAANTTAHRSSAEQTPALLAALKYDTKGNLTLHKFHSWFIQVWGSLTFIQNPGKWVNGFGLQ